VRHATMSRALPKEERKPLTLNALEDTSTNGGVNVDVPRDGILRISLNRPHRLNALDDIAVERIHDALDLVACERSHRVVLLRSLGRAFCSGFDMSDYDGDPESRGGAAALVDQMNRLADIPLRLRASRAVVVAAVRGPAVGGGFGLALGADIVLVGESAVFSLPQTRLGVLAAEMGISFLLPRVIGTNRAADLMLRGRTLDAAGALAAGLAAEVWPDEDVDDAALRAAIELCNHSADALAATKQFLLAGLESGNLTSTVRRETDAQVLSNYRPELRASIARRRAEQSTPP
jgi:enoyl-CoA hydratase